MKHYFDCLRLKLWIRFGKIFRWTMLKANHICYRSFLNRKEKYGFGDIRLAESMNFYADLYDKLDSVIKTGEFILSLH